MITPSASAYKRGVRNTIKNRDILQNRDILRKQKTATIIIKNPVTKDRNRFFADTVREERRQLFFT
jgi:hypothetical protein